MSIRQLFPGRQNPAGGFNETSPPCPIHSFYRTRMVPNPEQKSNLRCKRPADLQPSLQTQPRNPCRGLDTHDPKYSPTRHNIISAMQWLTAGVQPGEVLFFRPGPSCLMSCHPNAVDGEDP